MKEAVTVVLGDRQKPMCDFRLIQFETSRTLHPFVVVVFCQLTGPLFFLLAIVVPLKFLKKTEIIVEVHNNHILLSFNQTLESSTSNNAKAFDHPLSLFSFPPKASIPSHPSSPSHPIPSHHLWLDVIFNLHLRRLWRPGVKAGGLGPGALGF